VFTPVSFEESLELVYTNHYNSIESREEEGLWLLDVEGVADEGEVEHGGTT
jgi:hypothetical protein